MWSYIAENKGFIRRILDFNSFAMMSFIFGLFIKTDVIIATSPQFFTTIAARFLSLFKRRPWIMEVRDLWPDSIVAVGSIKRSSIILWSSCGRCFGIQRPNKLTRGGDENK